MIRFMKLAGFLYMIFIMIMYFTFIDVFKRLEESLGSLMATLILITLTTTGFLSLMSLMKNRGSGPLEENNNSESGDYDEIDFSKNSPTVSDENRQEVKPIDFTGNVFEHNFETLEEDLSFLGESEKNTDK